MHLSDVGRTLALCLSLTALSGCGTVVKKEAPTISHIHIGHALTGWIDTPNKVGLLVTAEQEATIASANAELLVEAAGRGDLGQAKKYLTNLGHALNPEVYPQGNGKGYGLRKSTEGAISHLRFASESADASNNVLRTVAKTSIVATSALDKIDELQVLLEAGAESEEAAVLVELGKEMQSLASDIAGGPGKSDPNAYGLFEFRTDIEDMVAREDPPYSSVESFYLFNLIRLPDGGWGFAKGRRRRAGGATY